jgi:PAS domain S-box-containing protein
MESSFDYIFIKDLEGKYVVASQSLAELNGKSSWKEMIDKTDQEILPDYYPLFEKEDNRVLSSGVHIINNVQQFLDNNGQKRWIETTKEPIYGRSGKIIGLSGISRDISEQKKAEEEQLMLIATIENSQDLIYFLDNDLNIIYMNPYGKQVIGLKEGARINLSQLLESVTYKVVKNALEKIVAKQGVWHEEFDINKINTSESITMDHNIIAIYNEADEFVCFASVSRDVTERNKLQQEVMDAKIQGELINASLKAEDNERIRIAHELHDGIQQQIATVSIYLQSIDLKNEPEEVIEQSLAKLNETIGEIRRMSNRLLPRALMNVGLQGVIQDEVQTITKGSSLTLSFYENLGEDRIDSEVELNLYRIFQEAISNILKYSRAKEVEIQLLLNNNLLTLAIEDDGVGFYVKEREHAGIGLSSMKNRAESIGAHFELDSTPGVGTSLLIEVKL